jgi:hypothetical protein
MLRTLGDGERGAVRVQARKALGVCDRESVVCATRANRHRRRIATQDSFEIPGLILFWWTPI